MWSPVSGGEEFCLLLADMDGGHISSVFEDLRERIGALETRAGDERIRFTVSIGVCTELKDTLEEMIREADMLLYRAKEGGRNQVVMDCG